MAFSKTRVFVIGLLPSLVVLDLLNGVLHSGAATLGGELASPGQLGRGLVLGLALGVAVLVRAPQLRRLKWAILTIALLGLVGPAVGQSESGSVADLAREGVWLAKVLYAPALVLLFVVAYRRGGISLRDVFLVMTLVGLVTAASIGVAGALGIGQATYPLQGVGFKGVFISQNDVGLTLGLSLFATIELFVVARQVRFLAAGVVMIVAMAALSTRAAAVAAVVAPLLVLTVNAPALLGTIRRRWQVALTTGVVAVLLAGVTSWEIYALRTHAFQRSRFQQVAEGQVVLVRGIYLLGALEYLAHRPVWQDVTGEGQMAFETHVARVLGAPLTHAAPEVDWIDLFGGYGLLFSIVIYWFYIGLFRRARVVALVYGRSVKLVVQLILAWFLMHSVIAGHALTTVMAAGTLAPLLAYIAYLDGARVGSRDEINRVGDVVTRG
jgi:hypothetical protein